VNKRRLLKLADLLEVSAKSKKGIKFDLAGWGHSDTGRVAMSCGTTACAAGLAVVSGAFKRAGLFNASGQPDAIHPGLQPAKGRRLFKFEAIEKLFDLGFNESSWLFSDSHYSPALRRGAEGERAVAKRIRNFVAGKAHPFDD
jgi:hypothetical protein